MPMSWDWDGGAEDPPASPSPAATSHAEPADSPFRPATPAPAAATGPFSPPPPFAPSGYEPTGYEPTGPVPPVTPPTGEMPRPPVSDFGDRAWAPPSYEALPPIPPVAPPAAPAHPPYAVSSPPTPPSSTTGRPAPGGRGWRALLAVVIAVLLVGGGFALARATNDKSGSAGALPPTTTGREPVSTAPTVVGAAVEPVAAVASAVAPSVVQIETSEGLGSGVIYDSSGLIVTAAHVVGNESTVTVRTAAGAELSGKVVGSSPEFDVAVVKVNPSKAPSGSLPAATLATGVRLEVGQLAVAIGSPFGLDQTVTSGIVSSVDRAVDTLDGAIGMIQTDAAINPGNSGGALADRGGRVIGINDAIQSSSGGNEGVGFAIPIDIAKSVADDLVAGTPVEYAFLGVQFASTSPRQGGAVIADVQSGSPADKAGLKQGDRVVTVDGHPVEQPIDVVARVRSAHPGDTLTLGVDEGSGSIKQVQVTLVANHK